MDRPHDCTALTRSHPPPASLCRCSLGSTMHALTPVPTHANSDSDTLVRVPHRKVRVDSDTIRVPISRLPVSTLRLPGSTAWKISPGVPTEKGTVQESITLISKIYVDFKVPDAKFFVSFLSFPK